MVGYPYWYMYHWNTVKDKMYYPALEPVVVAGVTDPSNRVLASDAIIVNSAAIGGDLSISYKWPGVSGGKDMPNHMSNGKIEGGNTLYNDCHVDWNSMRDLQNCPEKHVWDGRTFDFWF